MSDLQGRVALVTGGGRDVGAGISRMLAERGASVAVNYHSSKAEAEAVVAEIKQAGGQAKAYQADIADAEIVKKMIADIKGDFGGLDMSVTIEQNVAAGDISVNRYTSRGTDPRVVSFKSLLAAFVLSS